MSPAANETSEATFFALNHTHLNDSIDTSFIITNPYTTEPSKSLDLFAAIVGWGYFLAWSCAFYPQIVSNTARKSVVGLNLDFVALNFTGFITYSIFNAGIFWIPQLQDEYFYFHPGGVIPVQLNDVLFSLHAAFAVLVWIVQAFLYEREGQNVSLLCIMLLLIIGSYITTLLVIAILGAMTWLTFIYYFSYVKLLTALTKYSPQVYLHYKRKTTTGFSMGGVLLDLTGGVLSILQMLLIAYNYSDFGSIVGDPTKLGLGLISVSYCLIFCVQNYLYRNEEYERI